MTGVKAPKIPPPKPDPEERIRRAATPERRARRKPVRQFRLRLIDAVALAAGGLLVLKLLSLLQAGLPESAALPEYGRAVARARTGFEPFDPVTTGSVGAKEAPAAAPEQPSAPPPAPAQSAPPAAGSSASPTERLLLEKLGARRDALRQKSDELELREKMLGEAERKLETGLGDLKKVEDKVDAAAKAKEDAEKQALKNIVTMYEAMKPKDAARVFDRLGLDVLVPIVLAMNPRKMSEVLAVMQPETAERLTVALANRARGAAGPQAQAGTGLPANELPAIDPGAPIR
ncbi:MotE family protein [Methylobacterium sp. NPDC080182]|uniref:MotE family protein n=1 Tax=Methylobacterium sp. NPDC080182 TaxID=3390590 RepID=UPI003D092F86